MSIKNQLRILVVDDMSTSRALIVQSLEAMGIGNIEYATSGAEALASLARHPVHLVVSDYNMPGMSGIDLLQKIRSDAAMRRTGFVLITGRADQALIDRGRSLGMNNFIMKPFTTPQLKACLEAVVGRL